MFNSSDPDYTNQPGTLQTPILLCVHRNQKFYSKKIRKQGEWMWLYNENRGRNTRVFASKTRETYYYAQGNLRLGCSYKQPNKKNVKTGTKICFVQRKLWLFQKIEIGSNLIMRSSTIRKNSRGTQLATYIFILKLG